MGEAREDESAGDENLVGFESSKDRGEGDGANREEGLREAGLSEAGLREGLIRLEWQMFFGVLLLSLAGVLWLHSPYADSRGVWGVGLDVGLMMLLAISGVTGFSLALRQGWFMPMNPVISTLGTTALRFLTVLMVAGVASATKWNNSNSFAYSLLGCYFIFLLLESCLSIRWHSAMVRQGRSRRLPS